MQASSSLSARPRGGEDGGNSSQTARPNHGLQASDGPNPLPSVTFPKGGGAIRDIGEKFNVNAATGSVSMSIPIPISPGRNGFQPALELSYATGSGNGPFGVGWKMTSPGISRKTDDGLPRYIEGAESDVFVFGGEDLVSNFELNGDRKVDLDPLGIPIARKEIRGGFTIKWYYQRIEGAFTRIEQWTSQTDANEIHWRTISKDNVTSIYGRDNKSRVYNPFSNGQQLCIFTWLLSETYSSDGNASIFEYKAEDSTNVPLGCANELNRSDEIRSVNRYLKTVKYGNKVPNRDRKSGKSFSAFHLPEDAWMFSLVFDYGEHDLDHPTPDEVDPWMCRLDPFSTYRASFEIRTYRLCRRMLLFHHFPDLGTNDCLVRSTDLLYKEHPTASFLTKATLVGYVFDKDQTKYFRKSMPPLDLAYSQFPSDEELAQAVIQDVDPESLENLPQGVDGSKFMFADLEGEGLSGVFVEQDRAWFYKRNATQPMGDDAETVPRFDPMMQIDVKPSFTFASSELQLMDLAADGHLDIVRISDNSWGFFERAPEGGWSPYKEMKSFPNLNLKNPNLKFVDVSGDGLPDILISEDDAFTVFTSLGEDGYNAGIQVSKPLDEEQGPRLVFADPEESIYLADVSGDGLMDIMRIRNGEVCYWPSLGYGRFGAKISMNNAPWFDQLEQFNHRYVHICDIDGSGTSDIIYVGGGGVDIYLNQAGNSLSDRKRLSVFPEIDNISNVFTVDLMGTGTSCLVWCSPLPSASRAMKYVDLTQGVKPNMLVSIVNNLGAESRFHYAPSTKFYQSDRLAGRPWVTRLAFPVHCVEKVETLDHVSRHYFVQRYAYHHGYFDGLEREFRGFAMVEQWDTEVFDATARPSTLAGGSVNLDSPWRVPPVHTKTWFHTGAFIDGDKISRYLAHEYFGAPSMSSTQDFESFLDRLLEDTVLPPEATEFDEILEACRSIKGRVLRTEVYSEDESSSTSIPYLTSETNYTVVSVQVRPDYNGHSVFMAAPRETITYHSERRLEDPRISHDLVLQIDRYGNALKSVKIAYGRTPGKGSGVGQSTQETSLVVYSEDEFTNDVTDYDNHLLRRQCASRSYQLYGFTSSRYRLGDFTHNDFSPLLNLCQIPFEQWKGTTGQKRRLLGSKLSQFRSDDLSQLLPLGVIQSMGIPGENYTLELNQGLLASVYKSEGSALLPVPRQSQILRGHGGDKGGYVDLNADGSWWIPSGRLSFTPTVTTPEQELAEARSHFFMVRRHTDPFGQSKTVFFDTYDLLPTREVDALDNERKCENDYRVLRPFEVTDENGNRAQCAFEELGFVVGTALMGKSTDNIGDSLDGFWPSVSNSEVDQFFADPRGAAATALLGNASTRIIYNFDRYHESQQPVFSASISRETHTSENQPLKIQVAFTYTDGYGREVQKKLQAEPGLVMGQPVGVRWVGSGWKVFNNKGKPVKEYEPFFDETHDFKFDEKVGVTSTLIYDPLDRVVAKIYPNHSWSKSVYEPWHLTTYDTNDTVLLNPKADADVRGYFQILPDEDYLPTWYQARIDGRRGVEAQIAARKAAAHADTPLVTQADPLGRTIVKILNNGTHGRYTFVTVLDIQGNPREMVDSLGRTIERNDFSLGGVCLRKESMEAGTKWKLRDVKKNPIYGWDSRNQQFRTKYDELRRPSQSFVTELGIPEATIEQYIYGETQQDALIHNLRGKIFQIKDQAGVVTHLDYDFKSNLIASQRRFAVEYKSMLNWSGDVALEAEQHVSQIQYDALNRIASRKTPENSTIEYRFNEGNLLDEVRSNLRGELDGAQNPIWSTFASGITHNARRQRASFTPGNGVVTTYTYDETTFLVSDLLTRRGADNLQALHYTYDPSGNVSNIRDNAQQTIYFRNNRVDPSTDFTYDPTYRLIEATGREHLGQTGNSNVSDALDSQNTSLDSPGDGNAMGGYTESYKYDSVGNILSLRHDGSDSSNRGWTRNYSYQERSQIEPAKFNNRLSSTSVGRCLELYSYDGPAGVHGNMTSMPHLSVLQWNVKDELQAVSQQIGGDNMTYYVYDHDGVRARKVTEDGGRKVKDRLYLGDCEILRKHGGDGTLTLKRETLHIMDDKDRIAIIETRTQGKENVPRRVIRYQLSNLIGSAIVELNEQALIVSYEEYTPYGSTSYQAVHTEFKKRYRYCGKERDTESGLYYMGARYYAPWLTRWISADPAGVSEGGNLFCYGRCNPIRLRDVTGLGPEENQAVLRKIFDDAAAITEALGLPKTNMGSWGTKAHQATNTAALAMRASGGEFADRIFTSVVVRKGTLKVLVSVPLADLLNVTPASKLRKHPRLLRILCRRLKPMGPGPTVTILTL